MTHEMSENNQYFRIANSFFHFQQPYLSHEHDTHASQRVDTCSTRLNLRLFANHIYSNNMNIYQANN